MTKWQDDPELFLYIGHEKCSVLHIWRCKRMSSSMPLKRQDFTDEIPVPGSKYLVRRGFSWPPASLKKLEEYIAPRHFLVNCQGLVYVELHKFGADEKGDCDQRIYLRLLDVVNMDAFELEVQRPKQVPFRTVEYLEDGTAAEVCPGPNEKKLSAVVEALERELNKMKGENKQVLVDELKRSKEREAMMTAELEKEKHKNKQALKDKEAELNKKTKEITILKEQLDKERLGRKNDKKKIAELEEYKLINEKEKAKEKAKERGKAKYRVGETQCLIDEVVI